MSFVYPAGKLLMARQALDSTALRALLVMTDSTAYAETGTTTLSGFTHLDEYSGGGYERKLLKVAFSEETMGFESAEVVWHSLREGPRRAMAMIAFQQGRTDADSIPIGFIDSGFPFYGNGGPVRVSWPSGLLQIK